MWIEHIHNYTQLSVEKITDWQRVFSKEHPTTAFWYSESAHSICALGKFPTLQLPKIESLNDLLQKATAESLKNFIEILMKAKHKREYEELFEDFYDYVYKKLNTDFLDYTAKGFDMLFDVLDRRTKEEPAHEEFVERQISHPVSIEDIIARHEIEKNDDEINPPCHYMYIVNKLISLERPDPKTLSPHDQVKLHKLLKHIVEGMEKRPTECRNLMEYLIAQKDENEDEN